MGGLFPPAHRLQYQRRPTAVRGALLQDTATLRAHAWRAHQILHLLDAAGKVPRREGEWGGRAWLGAKAMT